MRRQRSRDGIAAAAPEVQNVAAGGQQTGEEIDPRPVNPRQRAPLGVPIACVAFVVAGDQVGEALVRSHAGSPFEAVISTEETVP